jgi:hypothetical protein
MGAHAADLHCAIRNPTLTLAAHSDLFSPAES